MEENKHKLNNNKNENKTKNKNKTAEQSSLKQTKQSKQKTKKVEKGLFKNMFVTITIAHTRICQVTELNQTHLHQLDSVYRRGRAVIKGINSSPLSAAVARFSTGLADLH